MTEHSVVQFGRTRIPFEVRRSSKRKTVALAVDGAGGLTVTAPPAVSVERLDDVVRAKGAWVVERVKRASDRPPAPAEREFTSGETVRYLGRQYRLSVLPGEAGAKLQGGWLTVRSDETTTPRNVLTAWFRKRAEAVLPARLACCCSVPPPLLIAEQKSRWGSCDAHGILRINWRIVQAPAGVIDYVLMHEVTHLTHLHHGTAFWAALGRRMPEYERRRAQLLELGPALVW
jgi:predicted metal-dependent hydrolase